jgi:hypothetical protein
MGYRIAFEVTQNEGGVIAGTRIAAAGKRWIAGITEHFTA